ncbi:TMEM175 family protein [Micromonosporaceae bacterium B7E4]
MRRRRPVPGHSSSRGGQLGRAFSGTRKPDRVVTFSDAVFAIAVTLLVLEIHAPADFRRLPHALTALWPSFLAYVITFLLIGQVWVNHHVLFDHIRAVDRLVLFVNTLLLMDIAFLPFAASVLSDAFHHGEGQRAAVVFYGLTLEAAPILFNVIWEYVRRRPGLLDPGIDEMVAASIARRFRLALFWIAAGTALGGFFPLLGVAVIAAFIPAYWLPIRGETAGLRRAEEEAGRRRRDQG